MRYKPKQVNIELYRCHLKIYPYLEGYQTVGWEVQEAHKQASDLRADHVEGYLHKYLQGSVITEGFLNVDNQGTLCILQDVLHEDF